MLSFPPVGRVAGEVPERQQERGPEGEPVGGQQGDKPQREASPAGVGLCRMWNMGRTCAPTPPAGWCMARPGDVNRT